MSVRTMARVWESSRHAGTELLMLLAIADFADDDGRAYPAVDTLAEKCRMSPRNARYILKALRDSGELQIHLNAGQHGQNRYRIAMEALRGVQSIAGGMQPVAGVQSIAGVHLVSSTPAAHFPEPLQPIAAKPPLNHQEPPAPRKRPVRQKSDRKTLKVWFEDAKAKNEEVFEKTDPLHAYLETVGISWDLFLVHWKYFKAKYWESPKVQASWPQTLLNSIKGNYGGLLWRTPDGMWKLSTAGKLVAIEHGYDENMTAGQAAVSDWTRSAG